MRNLFSSSVIVASLLAASPLLALEPSFSIQQTAFQYGSSSVKDTPNGGDSMTTKSSAIQTMPNSLMIYATLDKLAFYVYPTMENTPLGIGYYVTPEIEVGLNLAIGSAKADHMDGETEATKIENSSSSFGPYVTYYHSVGETQLEFFLNPSFYSEKTKITPATAAETKSSTSGMTTTVSVLALYPLAKNFFYGAGFGLIMDSNKESESDTKSESTEFGLNLATFRFNF